ncbi:MAG: hypothetical protein JST86_02685 [Bacteroidetes bacterium]|nr:hypothetical protein [Bacteroidota bacterium]
MKAIVFALAILFCNPLNIFSQSKQDSLCLKRYICKYYKLDEKTIREWNEDSTGCNQKRIKHLVSLEENNLLIGMPKDLFCLLFGTPNQIKNDSNECDYIYYVTITCDSKNRRITDSEFMNLVVVFKDDKVALLIKQIS